MRLQNERKKTRDHIINSVGFYGDEVSNTLLNCMNINGISEHNLEKLLMSLKKEILCNIHGDLLQFGCVGLDEITKNELVKDLIDEEFFVFCDEYVNFVILETRF